MTATVNGTPAEIVPAIEPYGTWAVARLGSDTTNPKTIAQGTDFYPTEAF
jgi:hypothetical protein